MTGKIVTVGTRVSALVGPKTIKCSDATDFDEEVPQSNKKKWCKTSSRTRFTGIVVASAPNCQWTIFWINIGQCTTHYYNVLKHKGNDCDGEFNIFDKGIIDKLLLEKI